MKSEAERTGWSRRYQTALLQYLEEGSEASVRPALQLGRAAVALGLVTLDVARSHEQALLALAKPGGSSAARQRILDRAKKFFAEVISPIERTHDAARRFTVHIHRLNKTLDRRTAESSDSARQLERGIARRQTAEAALKKSGRQHARLQAEAQRLQKHFRHLTREILSAQEDERQKISSQLHDEIAQTLLAINVRLLTLNNLARTNAVSLKKEIADTQQLVEKSVAIVHRFAYDLRPAALDHLGLIPALLSFMKSFTKQTGVRVSLAAFAEVDKLDSARRTVLFRVAQEALTNVARHAQASRVDTIIRRLPKAVHMQIKDDGKSFDAEQTLRAGKSRRMGLLGMRERVEMVGGSFRVESWPGKGTIIQVQLPFSNRAKESTGL